MRKALLLGAALGLAGCQTPWEREPSLSPEQARFARLFAQSRIATQAFAGDPEKARAARQALLAKDGMTLERIRACTAQLQAEPRLWLPFWKAVREHAQENGGNDGRKRPGTDGRQL